MRHATTWPRAALWHLVLALVLWVGQSYNCSVAVTSAENWTSALADCDDVVVSGAGFTVSSEVTIAAGRTVTVSGGGWWPTLDCQFACRFFTVSSGSTLALSGLVLRQGRAGFGGTIYASGVVELVGVRIEDAEATVWGGGIFSMNQLVVRNSTFANCSAASSSAKLSAGGGAIYVYYGGWLQIDGSEFRGCRCVGSNYPSGGALYMMGSGGLNVTNSLFVDNYVSNADYGAAAIYTLMVDQVRIHNSSFRGNGGAVNSVAVYVYSVTLLEVTHSDFRSSDSHVWSEDWMGGIRVYGGTTVVTNNVQFMGNRAEFRPVLGLEYVTLWTGSNINVTGNEAVTYGTVYLKGTEARLEDFSCLGNRAGLASCMVLWANTDVTLTRATIANNNGTSGGAFWLGSATATLTIVDSLARDNAVSASSGSGALVRAEEGSTLVLTRTAVRNCSAMVGGAIYLEDSSAAIINSTIHGCTAQEQGGALAVVNSDVNVTNSTLSDNAVLASVSERCVTLTMKNKWDLSWTKSSIQFYEADSGTVLWSGKKTNNFPSQTQEICFLVDTVYEVNYAAGQDVLNSYVLEGVIASTATDQAAVSTVHNFTVDASVNEDYTCLTNGGGTLHMSETSNVKISDTSILGSRSGETVGGVAYVGGQSESIKGTLTMDSCTIGHSSSNLYGAVFYNLLSQVVLTNTWVDNTSTSASGMAYSFAGSYNCLSSCPAGQYGECTAIDDCASCVLDSCLSCPPGKHNPNPGSTSAADCTDCSAGKYASQSGAAACTSPCPAGMYTTDNSEDSDGYGVVSGATSCMACPPGRFSTEAGGSECSSCSKGYFSEANSTECTACPAGSFSDADASSKCMKCGAKYYSEKNASTSCAECTGLGEDSYPGSTSCNKCQQFFVLDGTTCEECSDGMRCAAGTTTANLWVKTGYWRVDTTTLDVFKCPRGSLSCKGGNLTGVKDGLCRKGSTGVFCEVCEVDYFRKDEESKCTACPNNVGAAWESTTTLVQIVVLLVLVVLGVYSYTYLYRRYTGKASALRCCSPRPKALTPDNAQDSCNATDSPDHHQLAPATSTSQLLRDGGSPSTVVCGNFEEQAGPESEPDTEPDSGPHDHGDFDAEGANDTRDLLLILENLRTEVKIVVQTMQIIGSWGGSLLHVDFPEVYVLSLSRLGDIFSLDLYALFPTLNVCLVDTRTNLFFPKLFFMTLAPLGGCCLLLVGYHIAPKLVKPQHVQNTRDMIASAFFFATFLVFISCSTVILQTFQYDLDLIDSLGDCYLTADYGTRCDTTRYYSVAVYASMMCLVYPIGIPLVYFVVLLHNKDAINPTLPDGTRPSDVHSGQVQQIMLLRSQNPDIVKFNFLWEAYEPRCWWYEVYECIRRLSLSSAVVVMFPGSTRQIFMTLFFSLVALKVASFYQPYVEDSADFVSEVSMWAIVLSLLWLICIDIGDVFPGWLVTAALLMLGLVTLLMGFIEVCNTLFGVFWERSAEVRLLIWEKYLKDRYLRCMSHSCMRGVARCCGAIGACVAWVTWLSFDGQEPEQEAQAIIETADVEEGPASEPDEEGPASEPDEQGNCADPGSPYLANQPPPIDVSDTIELVPIAPTPEARVSLSFKIPSPTHHSPPTTHQSPPTQQSVRLQRPRSLRGPHKPPPLRSASGADLAF